MRIRRLQEELRGVERLRLGRFEICGVLSRDRDLDRTIENVPQIWNTSWLVRDGSAIGALLTALVGYRSRPSLLEVLVFFAYFPPMLWALRRATATAGATVALACWSERREGGTRVRVAQIEPRRPGRV